MNDLIKMVSTSHCRCCYPPQRRKAVWRWVTSQLGNYTNGAAVHGSFWRWRYCTCELKSEKEPARQWRSSELEVLKGEQRALHFQGRPERSAEGRSPGNKRTQVWEKKWSQSNQESCCRHGKAFDFKHRGKTLKDILRKWHNLLYMLKNYSGCGVQVD